MMLTGPVPSEEVTLALCRVRQFTCKYLNKTNGGREVESCIKLISVGIHRFFTYPWNNAESIKTVVCSSFISVHAALVKVLNLYSQKIYDHTPDH